MTTHPIVKHITLPHPECFAVEGVKVGAGGEDVAEVGFIDG